VYQDYYQVAGNIINKKVTIPLSQFALSVTTLQNQENAVHHDLLLTEKSTGRKQVLLTDFYVNKIELIWSGDLDSDGIMDFIVSYSSENSYGCQLFISSLAKGKQLIKPVKIYWYGDCC
jgi:hypothetical protein